MDSILDRALSVRGVIGVIILSATWLTIASRGQLTSNDAFKLEELLSWVDEDTTGALDWGEGGSVIHFHKAETHTVVLLKRPASEPRRSSKPRSSLDFGLTPLDTLDDVRASLSVPSSGAETIRETRPRSWY